MPYIATGDQTLTGTQDLRGFSYDYDYPGGLDLKPGSRLHQDILVKIMRRGRESHSKMSQRYENWRLLDRNLTAYVALDDAEKKVKKGDERKPVRVVVPYSYATLETLLTYMVSAFLNDPIFQYDSTSPEDTVGVALLEKVVDLQSRRSKAALSLYTMFRDGFVYGVGATSPSWQTVRGYKTMVHEGGFFSNVMSKWVGGGKSRVSKPTILYEGNRLDNIDPYMLLLDPNVPVTQMQSGEFCGWVESTNVAELLGREKNSEGAIFNALYARHLGRRKSQFNGKKESGRDERFGTTEKESMDSVTSPLDIVYMYVNLIPQDWDIGDSQYPEKWLFGVAGDSVITEARPLGLDHNMYPMALAAPDSDGYSTSPVSRLEILQPLQETLDWMFSSHVTNVRKVLNDMLIVDPSLININDLKQPGPGRLIRLRRAAWGRGVENAVKQLDITDVTKQHIGDSSYIIELFQRVSAATDIIQGVMRKGGERVTAQESMGVRSGALSRLAKTAKLVSLQAMQDLGYMFASHTQQFMTQDLYVKMVGRWQEDLVKEYGVTKGKMVKVSPFDLIVDYDVTLKDGTITDGDNAEVWVQLYSILVSNPEMSQRFDLLRIFKHIASILGAKNVEEFEIEAKPDEEVAGEAAKGNLVPIPEGGADTAMQGGGM